MSYRTGLSPKASQDDRFRYTLLLPIWQVVLLNPRMFTVLVLSSVSTLCF